MDLYSKLHTLTQTFLYIIFLLGTSESQLVQDFLPPALFDSFFGADFPVITGCLHHPTVQRPDTSASIDSKRLICVNVSL